jgi:hypothetical protein
VARLVKTLRLVSVERDLGTEEPHLLWLLWHHVNATLAKRPLYRRGRTQGWFLPGEHNGPMNDSVTTVGYRGRAISREGGFGFLVLGVSQMETSRRCAVAAHKMVGRAGPCEDGS